MAGMRGWGEIYRGRKTGVRKRKQGTPGEAKTCTHIQDHRKRRKHILVLNHGK